MIINMENKSMTSVELIDRLIDAADGYLEFEDQYNIYAFIVKNEPDGFLSVFEMHESKTTSKDKFNRRPFHYSGFIDPQEKIWYSKDSVYVGGLFLDKDSKAWKGLNDLKQEFQKRFRDAITDVFLAAKDTGNIKPESSSEPCKVEQACELIISGKDLSEKGFKEVNAEYVYPLNFDEMEDSFEETVGEYIRDPKGYLNKRVEKYYDSNVRVLTSAYRNYLMDVMLCGKAKKQFGKILDMKKAMAQGIPDDITRVSVLFAFDGCTVKDTMKADFFRSGKMKLERNELPKKVKDVMAVVGNRSNPELKLSAIRQISVKGKILYEADEK